MTNFSNNEYSKAVFLRVPIWRIVLSFLPDFRELAKKTRILMITKMCEYLDINYESDVDVYFSKLVIPDELWKVPFDIILIGQYVARGVIATIKSNTTLQRKNRPLKVPRNPNYYFSNLDSIINEIKRKHHNVQLSKDARHELMIFLHLFSLMKTNTRIVYTKTIRYIIESYISKHVYDNSDIGPCITCDTITCLANYTDLLSTVHSIRLCTQCNRILSNA